MDTNILSRRRFMVYVTEWNYTSMNYCPWTHWHAFIRSTETANYNNPIQKLWREKNYELQKIRNSNPVFQAQFDTISSYFSL